MKAIEESQTGQVDPDSFNYIEVFHIFAGSNVGIDKYNYDDDEILAELIAEAWRGRLLTLFPKRKFVVDISPLEETDGEVRVGFKEILE